jgi:hypothetical protein
MNTLSMSFALFGAALGPSLLLNDATEHSHKVVGVLGKCAGAQNKL